MHVVGHGHGTTRNPSYFTRDGRGPVEFNCDQAGELGQVGKAVDVLESIATSQISEIGETAYTGWQFSPFLASIKKKIFNTIMAFCVNNKCTNHHLTFLQTTLFHTFATLLYLRPNGR